MAYDYPWSSGALYFRHKGYWTSPKWTLQDVFSDNLSDLSQRNKAKLLRTHIFDAAPARLADGMVFPGEYVAVDAVEKIYRSVKSFNYFMCISKESDVESRGGAISHLSGLVYDEVKDML